VEEVKGSFRRRYYQVVVEGTGAAGSMELWLSGKVEVEQDLCRYLPPDRLQRAP
jgi:hypothetical protein